MTNLVSNLSTFFNHDSSIQLLGIVFDIAGAFYLSRAFIFKKPADIKSEVYGSANQNFTTSFSTSHNQFFSLYIQGVEARIGFFLLFAGFLLQGIGIVWSFIILPIYVVLIIGIAVMCISGYARSYFTNPKKLEAIHDRDEREFDERLKK